MNTKASFYASIPATVRYDKRLTPQAKLFYLEVAATLKADGISYEKSDYYMEVFEVDRDIVKSWLMELRLMGHIHIQKEPAFGVIPTTGLSQEYIDSLAERRTKKTSDDTDNVDHKWVVQEYHRICTTMRKVRALSSERHKKIRARFIEVRNDKKVFTELFTKANASKFLRGENPNQRWKADFDFLISPTGFAKTLEGKYDGVTSSEPPPDDEL